MPPQVTKPEIDAAGRFVTGDSGLLVPRTYQRAQVNTILQSVVDRAIDPRGLNEGYIVTRDGNTLAVRFPAKGSGLDDQISEAIVDGRIANIGVSPVIAPQISGMVRRQQNQAVTASLEITGKTSPQRKAVEALARFNDSPLGVTTALEQIVYGLCVHNRGAPVATVPIIYAFEDWEANGLNAIPILGKDETEENAERFYLEVDWGTVGTPVPYLPSVYDLEPTGVSEWPYWYRAYKQTEGVNKRAVWVLLHASQIIPMIPGTSSVPGIGTSAVWMCLGFLAEDILVTDERTEKMMYALTDGILLLGGINGADGDTIMNKVKESRAQAQEQGYGVAKGVTIITSMLNAVSSAYVSFRQPSGVEFQKWREYCEDVLSFCFGETLSALVVRGGVGFGVQAETASDNSAEAGVGAILHRLALTLGAIYPRVQISVNRPNDRAKRLNVKTLVDFSDAVAPLIDKTVLTPEEARLIIERDVFTIPKASDTSSSASVDDSSDDPNDNTDDQADDTPADDGAQTDEELDTMLDEAIEEFDVLYDDPDDDVEIDDDDVDTAIERARKRISPDLGDLLNAKSVDK